MDSVTFFQLLSVVTFVYIAHLHNKIGKLSVQIETVQTEILWAVEETSKRVQEIESSTYDIKATVDDMNDFQHGTGRYSYDPNKP